MNDETKIKVTQASIEAMERALDDHSVDIDEHVDQHTISGGSDGHTAWATMDLSGDSPNWREHALGEAEEREPSPAAIHLRAEYHATAAVQIMNQETNRFEDQELTPEQQEIADRYASKAVYRLAAIGLADVPEAEALDEEALAEVGGTNFQAEKLNELMNRSIRMAEAVSGHAALICEMAPTDQEARGILIQMAAGCMLLEKAKEAFEDIAWVPVGQQA